MDTGLKLEQKMITERLFNVTYWLWLELQLGSPLPIQQAFLSRLHLAKETTRLLANPYLTLYQWQGHNEAGPLTVNYAGLGFAKPMLRTLLFTNGSLEKKIGRVPLYQFEKLANPNGSDVTIVELSKNLIYKLPRQKAVILPFRIQLTLDIRGEWSEVEGRFHRNVRRNARKAREYSDYEYEISRSEQDLELFYHTMYLPTVQTRHGDQPEILSKSKAHHFLKYGWLFFLKQNGVKVCGCLAYARPPCVDFKEMGVLNGDLNLMKQGVVEAMNYLRIRWTHQQSYEILNFGDNWPYLSGMFQAKRKWGAAVSIPSYEHKRIWLKVQQNTPAVAHFLQHHPCVISDNQEKLYGFIPIPDFDAVTPQMEMEWFKLYATPGLAGLIVCSATNPATTRLYESLFHD